MNRCDTSPLLAYHEALEQLTNSVAAVGKVVDKPLLQVQGAVLAESIESEIDVPGCAMSSMDGYAINTADLATVGETSLPLSQRIAAGTTGVALAAGMPREYLPAQQSRTMPMPSSCRNRSMRMIKKFVSTHGRRRAITFDRPVTISAAVQ